MVISNPYSVENGVAIIPEGTTILEKPVDDQSISNLRILRIPKTVIRVDFEAWYFAKNLEEIIVEDGNPVYDSREGCNALIETASNTIVLGCKNTIIPNSIEYIGRWSFEKTQIEEIFIPSSVIDIDCGAFSRCSNLKSVTLSEGLKSIGAWAFERCPIKKINLPESLVEINSEVFIGCTNLERLYIPKNVEDIDTNLTGGCTSLKEIIVDQNNKFYDSREGCNAIIETASNTLMLGCASTIIPNGVQEIMYSAFRCIDGLKEIIIPSSVVEIREGAFFANKNLESVIIHAPLKHILKSTFVKSHSLTKLHLAVGVKKISESFVECNLNEISVPFGKVEYYKQRLPENLHKHIVERVQPNLLKKD